jgi:hypothetical protein
MIGVRRFLSGVRQFADDVRWRARLRRLRKRDPHLYK